MQVREGMSTEVLVIGPDHTLREASRAMARAWAPSKPPRPWF